MARLMKVTEIMTLEELESVYAGGAGAVTTSFPFDLAQPGGVMPEGAFFVVGDRDVMRLSGGPMTPGAC